MFKFSLRNFSAGIPGMLVIFVGSLVFLTLPILYGQKMSSGMAKVDLYLIWLVGSYCWARFSAANLGLPDLVLATGILHAVFTTLPQVEHDVNSYKVLITLFFSFGIYTYVRSRQYIATYLSLMILPSLIFQLLIGYWQLFRFEGEPLMIKASFFNSGYLANWLAVCSTLLLAYIFKNNTGSQKEPKCVKLILGGIMVASLFLLVATLARAAMVGFITGCLFLICMRYRKFRILSRLKWIPVATIVLLIFVAFGFSLIKKDSVVGRYVIYNATVKLIGDHLWTGTGADRFQVYYNLYQARYFRETPRDLPLQMMAGNTFEAFNFILQWWAEYGLLSILIGSIYFFILYRQRIKEILKEKEISSRHGSIAAILCILSSALFSNTIHCSVIFLLFIIVLAGQGSLNKEVVKELQLPIWPILVKWPALLTSVFFLYFGIRQLKAELIWEEASSFAKFGNFYKAKPLYEQAYYQLKTDGRFLYNYGAESAQANDIVNSTKLLERARKYHSSSNLYLYLGINHEALFQYQSAERDFKQALDIRPSSILPKYKLIHLYLNQNKNKDAAKWIDYTLQYPVKIKNETSYLILSELSKIIID